MKHNNKIHTIVFLLCMFGTSLLTDAKPVNQKNLSICGQSDSAVSVEIRMYPEYYLDYTKNYVTYNDSVIDGKFAFKIPVADHPVYVIINFNMPNGSHQGIPFYIMQGGDSVFIMQNKKELNFSGRSAGAFECQYKIQKIKPTPMLLDLKNTDFLLPLLEHSRNILDSTYAKKLLALESFKRELSIDLYETLKTDIVSDHLVTRYSTPEFYLAGLKRDTLKQQQVIDYYKNYLSSQALYVPGNNIALEYSRLYIDYLLQKTRMDVRMQENKLKPVYNAWSLPGSADLRILETSCPEKIKDKLITAFFTRLTKLDDSLTNNLQTIIKQTRNKFFLQTLLGVERKTRGSIAYDFTFPDSNGKMINLHDFKGKVVAIDFWYTGCPACPALNNAIHPLTENKDSNVIFVTVSIDKDKNTWKKSLQRGIYTSENEINLFTAGQGSDHPYVTYYGINAYPFLLIITPGGKISSINPSISQSQNIATQKIKDAIIMAAKEN